MTTSLRSTLLKPVRGLVEEQQKMIEDSRAVSWPEVGKADLQQSLEEIATASLRRRHPRTRRTPDRYSKLVRDCYESLAGSQRSRDDRHQRQSRR
tara:strand:+ start:241 stop:525 length:285 start_codon:yes stop_codon:yes gene_type:complete